MAAIQRFAAGMGDEHLVTGYGEVEIGGDAGGWGGEEGDGECCEQDNAEQEEGCEEDFSAGWCKVHDLEEKMGFQVSWYAVAAPS